jgi:hypothetical protein
MAQDWFAVPMRGHAMPVAIISSNRRRLTCTAATAIALFWGAGAGSLYLGVSSAAAANCAAGTCSLTFGQAGAIVQEWEVPNGVSGARFLVNGAGGGSNTYGDSGGGGGNGAQATATIPVTGGDALKLLVGTGGERTESAQGAAGGYGGGGGGGTGTLLGAPGGGGGSFVFGAGAPLIIAGGGGGAAVEPFPGGNAGEVGAYGGSYDENPGGEGASQSSGGLGGTGLATGESGTGPTTGLGALAAGGVGEGGTKFAGGGGGGGYYGGGGGGAGGTGSAANEYFNTGGGGGSSYVTSSGTDVEYSSAGGAGGIEDGAAEPGSIMISFTQPTTDIALEATSLSPAVSSTETFTANVSPTPSSGTVAFTEAGSAVVGCETVPVEDGEASCVTEYASPGPRELLAEYSGSTDTVYRPATSAPLGIAVTDPTSTSLGASSATPTAGAPVTFTATVSPMPDSGTIAFEDAGGTISGCAAVTVDVSTGGATCVTSLSTLGAHTITADFSGSLENAFTASASPVLSVTVIAPPSTVSTASSASASTPTPLATNPLTATRPSPAFALSILTREAKPLLNRRMLRVRARCDAVGCTVRTTMTVKLFGVRRALSVGSAATTLRAGEAGDALIAVTSKLRSTVRSYLRHHPHAAATLHVTVTASAAGHPSQTAHVTLAVSTSPHAP